MSAGGRTSPADGAPTGIAVDPRRGAGEDARACAVLASSLLAQPGDHKSAAWRWPSASVSRAAVILELDVFAAAVEG
jgi:hypothetical protein